MSAGQATCTRIKAWGFGGVRLAGGVWVEWACRPWSFIRGWAAWVQRPPGKAKAREDD